MLFSSIVFLFTFLPAVLVLYYLLPERFHNPVLLLACMGGTGLYFPDAVIHFVQLFQWT